VKSVRRVVGNGHSRRAKHETVQSCSRGEPKLTRSGLPAANQIDQSARREVARRDQPHRSVPKCQHRHAGRRRFDQPSVGERAGRARQVIERGKSDIERGRERAHIGLLIDLAHGDERAVGAGA